MSRVDVTLGGKNAGFKRMLADSKQEMRGFSKSVVGGLNISNGLQASQIGAQILGYFKQVFNQVRKEFDQIGKLGTTYDIDPSTLQKFGVAAALSGSSLNSFGKSMASMVRSAVFASEGLKTYAKEFDFLGINVEEFLRLDPEEKFLKLADAYATSSDKASAFTSVVAIMGRAGREMIPLLSQGSEGVQELLSTINSADEGDFRAIEKFNDDLTLVENNLKTLAAQVFPQLVAVVVTGWNLMTLTMRPLTNILGGLVGALLALTAGSGSFTDRMKMAASIIKQSWSDVATDMRQDVADIEKAWDNVKTSQDGSLDTLRESQRVSARLAADDEKRAAKAEAAAKRAAAADEKAAKKRQSDVDQEKKKQQGFELERKKAALDQLANRAQLAGQTGLASKLRARRDIGERTLANMQKMGITMEHARAMAIQQLRVEKAIDTQRQTRADTLEGMRDQASGLEGERDGLLGQAAAFRGGPDSLQSIGLGAGGVNYGSSPQATKLEKLAIARNQELEALNESIEALEIKIEEDEF